MNEAKKIYGGICALCRKTFTTQYKNAKYCTKACYMDVMKRVGTSQKSNEANMRDFIINLTMAIGVLLVAGCVYGYYNYQKYDVYTLIIEKL